MKPRHILVIRLSAIGDVAMTIPVLQQLLQQHPELQLTVLTQAFLAPLFEPLERTNVFAAETKGQHKGLKGIFRLYRQLKTRYKFDAVADLHNVLRSKLISFWFRTAGTKTATIDKGRKEKKQLTAKGNKRLVPLKTSFERYADVFNQLGFSFSLATSKALFHKQALPSPAAALFSPGKKHIGVAPFAKHQEKMYPAEKMKRVMQALTANENLQVFLLGGGKKETEELKSWESEIPGTLSLAGKFSFKEELAVISNMDMVISMDSANMHFASLFGVPVVSIWGATHPFAGFYGWNQPPANAVQIDLYCRPCSVFGNKPCYRGDHACMKHLGEELIVEKVLEQV